MTMTTTVSGWCDRAGHGCWRATLVLLACLLAPSGAAADGPGDYAATRFDVRATVLAGGSLDVTETITFEFQTGTFQKVWREIPSSRTDGIEIVEARMDGIPVSRGEGPGYIAVSGRRNIRVEWQFAPAGPSVHTFELRYIARGVAYRDGDRDVVRWRLLPAEHRYKIAESRGTIAAPVSPTAAPIVETRRVEQSTARILEGAVEIAASDVGTNGWVIAEMHYPAGSIVTTSPTWQQRETTASALAPRWMTAAAAIFVAGLVMLLLIRQPYSPPGFETDPTTTTEPPEPLPAALAAAVAGKGRASGFASVATLLDLADHGVLIVRELPRKLGSRNYELAQVPGRHDLARHEEEALSIAFAGQGAEVTMSRARSRLARAARRFSKALDDDLAERGLLDPSRKAVHQRLNVAAVVMLIVAGVGCIVVPLLIRDYGPWPFLMPLALLICGLAGLAMAAATTSLSDAGLLQRARWRGFTRHLKELADRHDDRGGAAIQSRWIVYGIALGLASQWSRYLKKHPETAPPWFVATADDTAGAGFAAFVGSGAASTSSAGAGGGAAGGGGSGAG